MTTDTASQPAGGRVDAAAVRAVEQEGFALLEQAYDETALAALDAALAPAVDAGKVARSGGTFAARNVLRAAPGVADAWRTDLLADLVARTLGGSAGLVMATFFDKPPGDSWAVPYHKDLTIAVKPGRVDSSLFSLPRLRDGVAVVEAPLSVLRGMLTLRVHLDPTDRDNGPLRVLVGSHATGKTLRVEGFDAAPVYAAAGDVLALRPLLAHASGHARPGVDRHRRVLQLTFAGREDLPDGYRWDQFVPVG